MTGWALAQTARGAAVPSRAWPIIPAPHLRQVCFVSHSLSQTTTHARELPKVGLERADAIESLQAGRGGGIDKLEMARRGLRDAAEYSPVA